MLTERYQSPETSKIEGDHSVEKILFERLRSVLLHQDLSVIKHNLLKEKSILFYSVYFFSSSWETDNCEDMWSEHSESM